MVDQVSDRDVWLAANALVKRHGDDAAIFAATRADEWLAQGDMEQYRLSKRILAAVDSLLATSVPPGTRLT
ncbi:hypothetical protein [Nitrospirillum pindoramense]|uniref:Uncharacterized protein n=1 Tax=Nitrospirillum amazonense TaxID=28077 RepID=A0A560H9Y3_9PROT|nr:hypothetical protein [Nitrospirillum amazonense]TWB42599.1 hypothetical protein FBZ90_106199 [Nitrospirillum amazonense]